MNKFIRAIEIIIVAIITDFIFLISIITAGFGLNSIFHLLLILLPFLCSILFYMIISSPSRKEKVAFNLFRLILLLALVKYMDITFLGGDSQVMFLSYILLVIFAFTWQLGMGKYAYTYTVINAIKLNNLQLH